MTTKKVILFFLSVLFLHSLESNGQGTKLKWFKGNLHTHSYWSDGDEFPEMIMDWYKTNGYNFVALSDHNILAEGEKWKLIPKSKLYEDSFEKYLKKYGPEWVNYKSDSGRTSVQLRTYKEYKPLFEEKGKFLIVQSEEISDSYKGSPIHLNATNIQKLIEPQGGQSVAEVLQNNIDAVLQQRQETGIPMIVHINHPNFHYAISADDMIKLRGERFFEVYNGHPQVNNPGDNLHPGTEEIWDRVNIAYAKENKPLLYAIATDDSHNYHSFGKGFSNAGRGWVMVKAAALTPESLIQALESGNFYASTGVTLKDIAFNGKKLSVTVDPVPGIDYTIQFIGCMSGEDRAKIFQETRSTKAHFTLNKNILFLRTKIISTKKMENPVHDEEYATAWTQPVVGKR